jgi:hypothetical protein
MPTTTGMKTGAITMHSRALSGSRCSTLSLRTVFHKGFTEISSSRFISGTSTSWWSNVNTPFRYIALGLLLRRLWHPSFD